MALFNFGKKKEKEVTCTCEQSCTSSATVSTEAVGTVKVLGGGCDKCNQLETATVNALKELNMDTTIEHVTDFSVIATYGVMSTPALVIDGKVVSTGKVLKKEEIINILKKVHS